jgi:deoxyribonuclease V
MAPDFNSPPLHHATAGHDWSALIQQWTATQAQLRGRLIVAPLDPLPRFVAGVDAAYAEDANRVFAAAVVYDRDAQRIIEVVHADRPIDAPYIPTFLSFREGPAVLDAIGKLRHPFGAVMFDGQGIAHPRRCGLAAHIAVTLDIPGVGVAKTRLIGTFDPPDAKAGSASPLMDADEQIGLVLRTRDNTNPLFISVGHRIDLGSAAALVLACCPRYRIPEPTRQADIEVEPIKRNPA